MASNLALYNPNQFGAAGRFGQFANDAVEAVIGPGGRKFAGDAFRRMGSAKGLGPAALGGLAVGGAMALTGDQDPVENRVGEAAGATAGSIAGGALFAPLGPVGSFVGGLGGSLVGGWLGGNIGNAFESPNARAKREFEQQLQRQGMAFDQDLNQKSRQLDLYGEAIAKQAERMRPEATFQANMAKDLQSHSANNQAFLGAITGLLNSAGTEAANRTVRSLAAGSMVI